MANSIAAVVLAAGASTRLGRPKQLVQFRGEALVRRAALAARDAGAAPVVVVLGAAPQAARELSGLQMVLVHAPDWADGMGASLRHGLAAVPTHAQAVLLTVCDQPLVDARLLGRLIAAWREGKRPIAAAAYGGTAGVPAVFGREMRVELSHLPADAGAKKLLAAHTDKVLPVLMPEAEWDVDTAEDLDLVQRTAIGKGHPS